MDTRFYRDYGINHFIIEDSRFNQFQTEKENWIAHYLPNFVSTPGGQKLE
jgi:hypothetical protein